MKLASFCCLALAFTTLLAAVAGPQKPAPSDATKESDAEFLKQSKEAELPVAKTEATAERAAYEAWFRKYRLDLNDPKMLDADADGDGVSNRDEFLADTNPRDATSYTRPEATRAPMRYTEFKEMALPLVLDSVSGGKAVIRNGESRQTVVTGDTLRGFPLRVMKVSARPTTDKEGAKTDRSQVELEDTTTRERVTLVKGLPAKTTATHGVLASPDGRTTVKVHAGEVFHWPGEPGVSYRVIDLARGEIVLQQQETKKMWTIPKQ
ncbi:MAG: hypothetical protein K8R23_12520 [Chthoniobacter sp.]|nr:hypothetical protein [Chthoniobacter sp.]